MSDSDNPLAPKNLLAQVLVTVIGGIILAFVIKDAAFAPPETAEQKTTRAAATFAATVAAPAEPAPPTLTAPAGTPVPSPTAELAATVAISQPTTPAPRFSQFTACLRACDGKNDARSFPERTKKIYTQWLYDDIPAGAHFMRSWSQDGREWVRYDCTWSGPAAGLDQSVLEAPKGLHGGEWQLTIQVDGQTVLQEALTVEGDNQQWEPQGVIYECGEK